MRIGIEAQRIFRKNKHGMDYVVLQEIKELQLLDTENEYYIFVKPGEDRCIEETKNFHVIEVKCPSYPLWEQVALPYAARKHNVDILHCTSNTAPIICNTPLVLTLHDIIFLEPRDTNNKSFYQNLGWLYRRLVVPRILDKCKRIITVSNFELKNIIGKLSIPESRMAMIYNGYNTWFKPINDVESITSKYIGETGYFFFLGNTDPKKNTERTLIAYSNYCKQSSVKRKLLVADLAPQYLEEFIVKNKLDNIRDQVVLTGYVVNSHLPYIYNGAFAFLYTSLRESFGIPLLEAMACGTPVITSNTSSMPEIGGKDAALVNPESSEEITQMMLLIENDNEYRERIKAIGLERVGHFSWKNTASNLLKLYKDVYKECNA
ncbi:MAG: glycosyltransferase family 4 protein [Prevotella sp.]|nr:glycosyltransferase family 4 protein [Prevotella sp.]